MQNRIDFLSANSIKIIALITMTIDHIGSILFPSVQILRVIGRIAYPLYAYFIAEGCRYTKNKLKYLALVFGFGILSQIVCSCFVHQIKLNILITFTFSILLIYLVQWVKRSVISEKIVKSVISSIALIFSITLVYMLTSSDFAYSIIRVDYGFWGIMLPVFVSIFNKRNLKLIMFAVGLVAVCLSLNFTQWASFMALIILMCYNGERGKIRLKYLYYAYYPLHLVVLYSIALIF